jgi:hypothetical protein
MESSKYLGSKIVTTGSVKKVTERIENQENFTN